MLQVYCWDSLWFLVRLQVRGVFFYGGFLRLFSFLCFDLFFVAVMLVFAFFFVLSRSCHGDCGFVCVLVGGSRLVELVIGSGGWFLGVRVLLVVCAFCILWVRVCRALV